MKIGLISDIHLDHSKNGLEEEFIKTMKQQDIDVLIIAGDITEDVDDTIAFIDNINQLLPVPVYYVPGNHDMWNRKSGKDTLDIYNQYKSHKYCITGKTINIDGFNFIGDIFWYDYSYANQEMFSQEFLNGGKHDLRVWKDKLYIDWKQEDQAVSKMMIDQLKNKLQMIDPRKTVVVSHMINHPYFKVPEHFKKEWGFFNAFLGAKSLYQTLIDNNVLLSVCGHVHFRRTLKENGTTFVCSCLGYKREWKLYNKDNISPKYQIESSLTIIDTSKL